ncbi:GATA zinc finger domain-containing protein 14-like [Galleria mellonella]|uniref:GATA zinc finger domain-containing protein 14-like n=1 Tax=Galleria mellonella TaxID=7137 RepID=A0ABM3MVI4_GALME|nr:GATA zinc finger domain-containing protein 14-like [Galleria mellonella]XP_052755168.1 GATA zinc finger domain-containing protein 14-like [Galleria mellonella]
MSLQVNDKKKALQLQKEKLLAEIRYYEKRIEEFPNCLNRSFTLDDCSSDSEEEFPIRIEHSRSVSELKVEQSVLKTRLQATQELTNLEVLQSEVKVLVGEPEFTGEPPVTEEGVWLEVTAECRVDLVPFSIIFCVHKPSRKFGAFSYRKLRVAVVKAAHETELAASVLGTVRQPSDAVEVLKSYAVAHRSRRTTLARLAEKYGNSLFMEPMAEGGYLLKCADLLEMSWTLQNKSRVAPFQHRMKFELEYMAESYIKAISQVHKQLSDPTITTDERTLLLAKIINIVLEAKGPTQELYESMESDPETASSLRRRRTTLDEPDPAIEYPVVKKKKDNEVMAPPKSLPKKVKRNKNKTNESNIESDNTKTITADVGEKTQNDEGVESVHNDVSEGSLKSTENTKLKENDNVIKTNKKSNSNDNHKSKSRENKESKDKENKVVKAKSVKMSKKLDHPKGDNIVDNEDITETNSSHAGNKNSKHISKSGKNTDNPKEKGDRVVDKVNTKTKTNDEHAIGKANTKNKKVDVAAQKGENADDHKDNVDSNPTNEKNTNKDGKTVKKTVKRVNSDNQVQNAKKIKTNNLVDRKNQDKGDNSNTKTVAKGVENNKKDIPGTTNKGTHIENKKLEGNKDAQINEASDNNKIVSNAANEKRTQKIVEKNQTVKSKSNNADTKQNKTFKNKNNNDINKQILNKITKNNQENEKNITNTVDKNVRKVMNQNKPIFGNKLLSNIGNGMTKTSSKIPQRASAQGFLKKNHLRISPRITPSKFKTGSVQKSNGRIAPQIPITSIPRLLKKPVTKI